MSLPENFKERVEAYSDVQLAQIIADAHNYTPEALKVVMAEWDNRKLTPDAVAPALKEVSQRKERDAQRDPTSPLTFNGIGLRCYGRDYARSVGYVTTQWFCALTIPLFPIRSYYVDQDAFGASGIASAVRINWRQVARVYLFLLFLLVFMIGVTILCVRLYEKGHELATLGVAFVSVFVPVFIPEIVRRRARRNRPNPETEKARSKTGRQ